jgi:hypothetical protein
MTDTTTRENSSTDTNRATRENIDDTDELRDTVEEAARELEAVGEPVTIARLAGATLRLGIDTDRHRFAGIAEACRDVIAERASTEVKTEVAR